VRVHFAAFDVKAGGSRTGKDFVRITNLAGQTVTELTGNLGDFWSPWSGDGKATVTLFADNVADVTNYRGVAIDKLEYTTATNGRFVMYLRMPGQIWEADAQTAYNYQRWYRAEDGRYVSPDPIGRAGGEDGYSAYVNSNPLVGSDPAGLIQSGGYCQSNRGAPGCPSTYNRRRPPGTPVTQAIEVRPGCVLVPASAISDIYGPPPTICTIVPEGRTRTPYCTDAFASSGATGDVQGVCSGGSPFCEVCGCDNLRRLPGRHTYCKPDGSNGFSRDECFGVVGLVIVDEPDRIICGPPVCQNTDIFSIDEYSVHSAGRTSRTCR